MDAVTIEEYAAAVITLLPVARRDTGQSRRCAQVLLSAYNGFNFQLAIPDLCSLDDNLYEAAITVIRGRNELNIEPHKLVQGGSGIFVNLHDSWPGLHVMNRGKVDCPICDGDGVVHSTYDDEEGTPCAFCDNTGRVCRCKHNPEWS